MLTGMRFLTAGEPSAKCTSLCRHHGVHLPTPRWDSSQHTRATWCSLWLLGHKSEQHAATLNNVGNSNTMFLNLETLQQKYGVIILWDHHHIRNSLLTERLLCGA